MRKEGIQYAGKMLHYLLSRIAEQLLISCFLLALPNIV